MRATDFQSRTEMDHALTHLCELLIQAQAEHPDQTGDVAACVLDPEGQSTTGISLRDGDRWIHAEVLACERYRDKFGDIPEGTMCVTTLSPCNRPMADRVGTDCASYLRDQGIDQVYAGHADQTQDADNVGITQNAKLRKLCKKFAEQIHQDVTESEPDLPEDYHFKVWDSLKWHADRASLGNNIGAEIMCWLVKHKNLDECVPFYEATIFPFVEKYNYPRPPDGPGDDAGKVYADMVKEIVTNWSKMTRADIDKWVPSEERVK